jgi:arsenate reductase-like glutaredoxin family protein
VGDFFSRRSPSVKKMGLDVDTLSDTAMKRLMREEPRLMRRPVLKVGRKVLIGFDSDAWDDALG